MHEYLYIITNSQSAWKTLQIYKNTANSSQLLNNGVVLLSDWLKGVTRPSEKGEAELGWQLHPGLSY